MKLSLVICTRNREDKIKASVQAVSEMSRPDDFELIVVDNASTDNTSIILHELAAEVNYRIVPVSEPRTGLAHARNSGWGRADGDIVAFTDDDCYVHKDFGYEVLRAFHENERLGYLGGRILLFDPLDLPLTIKESTEHERFPRGTIIPAGAIQGANFAFRRSALTQSGGFDPLLGAGTPFPAEDVELICRLSLMGWEGMYAPEPVVYHHHGRKTDEDARSLHKNYDVGRGAYYMAVLLKPGARLGILRYWGNQLRSQRAGRTAREVKGAFGYLWHSMRYRVLKEFKTVRGLLDSRV